MKLSMKFENELLINPRFPKSEAEQWRRLLVPLKEHLWIATSGSTAMKLTALSKEAVFASAESVNAILGSTKNDIWLNPLPFFHVGGLGIQARAALSGAVVIDCSTWDPNQFHELCSQATLTALVPAQLYDLVSLKLTPPPSLRAVIIGGGALQEPLYKQGVALGWKLLPSYGLTECASQVATASLGNPALGLLPHIQARIGESGCLQIKSPALFTCYLTQAGECIDPKREGWFETEDRALLTQDQLQILGRTQSFVKIGGESCDLSRLETILEELKLVQGLQQDVALVAVPDQRLGAVIQLAVTGADSEALKQLVEAYQQRVLPFERVRKIHFLDKLPRTPLSKLIFPELKRMMGAE